MKIPQIGAGVDASESVAAFKIGWRDPCCEWVLEPRFPQESAAPRPLKIGRGAPLSLTFGAPQARLGWLSLMTATYARRNRATLWCTLSDRHGRTLRHAILGADEVRDFTHSTVLDLSDLEFEVGAAYRLTVTSPAATEEDGHAVFVHDVPEGRYELHRRILGFSPERLFVPRGPPPAEIDAVPHDVVLAFRGAWNAPPAQMRATTELFERAFGPIPHAVVDLDRLDLAWRVLSTARLVVFSHVYDATLGPDAVPFDALCFALHRLGTATCFLDGSPFLGRDVDRISLLGDLSMEQRQRRSQRQRCHFSLTGGVRPEIECSFDPACRPDLPPHREGREALLPDELCDRVTAGREPHVVVVSVLYRKASVIGDFISLMLAQSYAGPITIVLVDDMSPENDAGIAEEIASRLGGLARRRIEVIRQEANSGNCASRLRGLQAVEGDIYVVMDCDCLVNEDFVAAHVFEHWDDKVDVVVGVCNIESGADDPVEMTRRLEREPGALLPLAELQDDVQLDGFLNCITRNFSIKRRLLDAEPLFDLDFSYSTKPGSGFGWEDVEMGYRLYRRGAVIRFTRTAFAVHCTHESSLPDGAKVLGSMRNFVRLFAKHDELRFVARRWALETYRRIRDWADAAGADGGETRRQLDAFFAAPLRDTWRLTIAYHRGSARRLRILSYRWHVPHQYELYKLPHDFTLATDLGLSMVDGWAYEQRPLRDNVRFRRAEEIDTADHDVAILHFDENVNGSELTNGTIPASWGDPFRRFLAIGDLPKLAICHGTPAFEGQYGLDPGRKFSFVEHARKKADLVAAMDAAGVHVICNSHQAAEEWGFARSSVIWHGFDPQQFPPGSAERHVLALSPDRHRPHYRGAWEHAAVLDRLDPGLRVETAAHPGCALERRDTNAFAEKNFRSYIDRIRQFTVYLNTTLRSPMPRSRGEAMMTGVIPVCLSNHDVGMFVRNGVNGFASSDPHELADFINFLFRNPEDAARIRSAARATAVDVFNHDRYLLGWTDLLSEAVGGRAVAAAA